MYDLGKLNKPFKAITHKLCSLSFLAWYMMASVILNGKMTFTQSSWWGLLCFETNL